MKKAIALLLALMLAAPAKSEEAASAEAEGTDAGSLELKFSDIQDIVSELTNKTEEAWFEQKKMKKELEAAIKDMTLQIEEIRAKEQRANAERVVELENLKNTTAMLMEELKTIKARADAPPRPIVQAPHEDGESLLVGPKDAEAGAHEAALALFGNGKYTEAALMFSENIKSHPDGAHFHDGLLHLGLSLEAIGKREEACKAFFAINESKEKIGWAIKSRAAAEYEALKCGAANAG